MAATVTTSSMGRRMMTASSGMPAATSSGAARATTFSMARRATTTSTREWATTSSWAAAATTSSTGETAATPSCLPDIRLPTPVKAGLTPAGSSAIGVCWWTRGSRCSGTSSSCGSATRPSLSAEQRWLLPAVRGSHLISDLTGGHASHRGAGGSADRGPTRRCAFGFADLDANKDGVLPGAADAISIGPALSKGEGKLSLTGDIGKFEALQQGSAFAVCAAITLIGVTAPTAGDLA
jgi:hypothetical protein